MLLPPTYKMGIRSPNAKLNRLANTIENQIGIGRIMNVLLNNKTVTSDLFN